MTLTIIILVAGIMLARSALFWLTFLQLKQYRLDRIWAESKCPSFWHLIFSFHRTVILVLLLGWLYIWSLRGPYSLAETLAQPEMKWNHFLFNGLIMMTIIYPLFYLLYSGLLLKRHLLRTPQWTVKIVALEMLIIGGEILILLVSLKDLHIFIFLFLLLEILQPVIVFGVFFSLYIPNIFLQASRVRLAKQKIAQFPKLIVIGITGSYGKTTTKEFLAHILSKKFKVLKTPAHINVDTGVAKVILRDLKPEHEIFIVEMGAYKKGEIKKICDLVRPQYAIMTGLSDQHLELFGSLYAIADTKFELVDAVKEPAHIVANADSEALVAEFKKRRIIPVWFSADKIQRSENIFGTAAQNNIAGAMTMARILGMDRREIDAAVQDLPMVPHTMEAKSGPNGTLLIDDTYNANTQGVLAALNDLAHAGRSKKIVIFSEVIELGQRSHEDHVQIAQAIARATDYALLLPSRQRQLLHDTLVSAGYTEAHILSVADTSRLKEMFDEHTVVLFEGREAEKVLH